MTNERQRISQRECLVCSADVVGNWIKSNPYIIHQKRRSYRTCLTFIRGPASSPKIPEREQVEESSKILYHTGEIEAELSIPGLKKIGKKEDKIQD